MSGLSFELWLEFEHWQPKPDDDPFVDFFNMQISLSDGRRYALNVWTFGFLEVARCPWLWGEEKKEPEVYVVAPDLFVEKLDRDLIEQVVQRMLDQDELKAEWLCPPDDDENED